MTQGAAPEAGVPYQVIARRYRPRFFREVVGQEAIAHNLEQAIQQGRLAHAYLFCGPRGVGKTSMARILARTLQCPERPPHESGDPCDQCPTCEAIFRGEDSDVQEMDGASHRGIDDVRDLIQHVRYAPTRGRYRIFIIDEVHMLTREAFNALLKTLEEPPPHVLFLFATTEPEKLPATVLSRCQRCDFAPISRADIARRLAQICESEGTPPEDGLLERVADLARGGMRDAQSLLDQLLSFSGGKPSHEDLDRITGRLAPARVSALAELLAAGDRAGVVRMLAEVETSGTDPAVLLEQLAEELRARLHQGVTSGAGWSDAQIEQSLLAQEILQEARLRTRQLGRPEIALELALLRIATLGDLVSLASLWLDPAPGARTGSSAAPRGTGSAQTPAGGAQRGDPPRAARAREGGGGPPPAPLAGRAPPSPVRAAPADSSISSIRHESSRDAPPTLPWVIPPSPGPAKASSARPPPEIPRAAPPEGPRSAPPPAAAPAAVSATPDDDRARVVAGLRAFAPTVALMVGDQFVLDGDVVELQLAPGAARFLEGKLDGCRRAVAEQLGRKIELRVAEQRVDPDEDLHLGSAASPDGTSPPPLVARAQELFKGTVIPPRSF